MHFFNRVSFSTPESVELEFRLAGIGNRALALAIDYSILLLVWLGFMIIYGIFAFGLMTYLEAWNGNYSQVPWWLLGIFILVQFVIYSGYFVYFEVKWRGQTPGKRFAGIRVIRDDGRPVQMAQATLRALLHSIDDLFYLGAFLIVFSKREKRLGDWVAGTIVVQDERGDRKNSLLVSEEAKALAAKLPEIADLSQLLPDDYAVIREYLLRRHKMSSKARSDKGLELARQLRHLIALETIPENTVADHFLEAVYLAYQERTGQVN